MDERLKEYLRQISFASQRAMDFVHGQDYASFLTDDKTQAAVAMNLIIIGEAAAKIADRFPTVAAAHPEIPWPYIRGLRNHIAHNYFDLNFAVIWKTVESELPLLIRQISAIADQQS